MNVLEPVLDRALIFELFDRIVDTSPPQEEVQAWFPGDDLFSPLDRPKGLPIGDLTSQWLANVFLVPFDRFVKEVLRVEAYLRYTGDFCLFADDRALLEGARDSSGAFLARYRLELNPKSLGVHPVAHGTRFLGLRSSPSSPICPTPTPGVCARESSGGWPALPAGSGGEGGKRFWARPGMDPGASHGAG